MTKPNYSQDTLDTLAHIERMKRAYGARKVARDGEVIRRPLTLMDGSSDDDADPRAVAYRDRNVRYENAWRGGDAGRGGPYGVTPSSNNAEEARAAYLEKLSNAWRPPPVREEPGIGMPPGARKPKPGLASHGDGIADFGADPDDLPAHHAASDADLEDAQQRRDDANAAYCERIANAWKEPK
jgi:hypothetical protein